MEKDLFSIADSNTNIEVVQYKENENGTVQFQIKYTKYFWVEEGNLKGYQELVKEFFRKKKHVPNNDVSKHIDTTILSKENDDGSHQGTVVSRDVEGEFDMATDCDKCLPDENKTQITLQKKPSQEEASSSRSAKITQTLITTNISKIKISDKLRTPKKCPTTVATTISGVNRTPLKIMTSGSTINSKKPVNKTEIPTTSHKTYKETDLVERFQCPNCINRYLRMSELRKHMRTHFGTNQYHCKICDLHCSKPSKLKRHCLTRTHRHQVTLCVPNVGYACSVCLKDHSSASELNDHIETFHRINPFDISTTTDIPTDYDDANHHNKNNSSVGESDNASQTGVTIGKSESNTNSNRDGSTKSMGDANVKVKIERVAATTTVTTTNSNTSNDSDGEYEVVHDVENEVVNCEIIDDPITGRPKYQCKVCSKSHANRKTFRMHLRIHDGTNPYYCPICKHHSLVRNEMAKHLLSKGHLERAAKCVAQGIEVQEIDPYKLKPSKKKLKIVIANKLPRKVQESPYACSVCSSRFTKKIHLQYHKLSAHSNNEGKFKCETCSVAFRLPSELKKHKLIHPNSRICKTCQKAFDSASLLIEHLKESSDCIGYKCAICECIFMDQNGYDNHITQHNEDHIIEIQDEESGEVKYRCSQCEKTFLWRKSCREHLTIHLGTSRHYCDTCDKYFGKKTHLVAHQAKVHSQYLSYQCDYCLATFKHANNLKLHKLTHTHIEHPQAKTSDEEFQSVSNLCELMNQPVRSDV